MNTLKSQTARGSVLFTALAFGVALVLPLLSPASKVGAAQLTSRTLTMASTADGNTSTDANGNAVVAGAPGNGAQTRHTFTYTHPGTATVGSIAIQYCTTPLFGTACTAPTGMDADTITTVQAESGYTANDFVIDTTTTANTGFFASSNACSGSGVLRDNCILLTDTTPQSTTGPAAISLAFGTSGTNWIKNPTADGPFYVRITTFATSSYTTPVDDGAVAGSVNEQIDITARVQEKLNFSVTGAAPVDPSTTCVMLSGSGAKNLGDSSGVLDHTVAYYTNTYFRLSTNASGGTLVQYSGDTLKNAAGTDSITALTTSPVASAPGTSQFGLTVDAADATAFGYSFTNLTRTAPYNSNTTFAYDTTSLTAPKTIATAASGTTVTCDTGSVKYVGNIATTTKAGIYKTRITYFATPTF